ncbi:Histone-fold [Phytophthora cactorum]|nr:Histone-fold [Phytophthora cactorum]
MQPSLHNICVRQQENIPQVRVSIAVAYDFNSDTYVVLIIHSGFHVWTRKGVKGVGTGGSKRHSYILRDNIQGISNQSIRRLAGRAGVKRIEQSRAQRLRSKPRTRRFKYTGHANRKTSTMDVIYALKHQGRTLYGFGA